VNPFALVVLLGLLGLALVLGLLSRYRKDRRRREEAKRIAVELVPEIRAAMAACDPKGLPTDQLVATSHFGLSRQRLPRVLNEEALFAVETFYQCVDAYQESAKAMHEAFVDRSESPPLSLGDKIRAKDRRDRCLKDVFYTGESALERLSKL
jgi:hypothetical protein